MEVASFELIAVFSLFLLKNSVSTVTEHISKDYCLDEKFTAECSDSDVILIDDAQYGRMTFGSCVQRDYGYIGCKVDVTTILANKCSGRTDCEVVNFETLFASYNRCPQDLKSYLQASYSCKHMTPPLDPFACSSGHVEPLPPPKGQSGFLSPLELRWGTPECPWRIQGQKGQRINLTLHDYSDFGFPDSQQPAFCRQYLEISDGNNDKIIMACSHELRHRTIYVSKTHELQLNFLLDQDMDPNVHFLLEFQVQGCPAPSVPNQSYIVDEGDGSLTVQCNFTAESWLIKCTNGIWEGRAGNCTPSAVARSEHLIPLGVSIIIIVGVALLVCTGVLVVGFLFIYCRRRKRQKFIREENRYFAAHHDAISDNTMCILNTRTKHASLEKSRTPYSPLTKTRTLRAQPKGGEYTHIWEVKHPIPCATPEVPKTHTFRPPKTKTITAAKSSPTMTCARSPVLPERHRDRDHIVRDRQPTFSTFRPTTADPYGIPAFKGESSTNAGSSHSSQSSPLYFEIDTQRRKATNHYST